MPVENVGEQDLVTMADLKNADEATLDAVLETLAREKEARKRAAGGSVLAQAEHERVVAELDAKNRELAQVTSALEEANKTSRQEAEAKEELARQAAEAAGLGERAARKVPYAARDELRRVINGMSVEAETQEQLAKRDVYWDTYKSFSEGAILAKMFPSAAERVLHIPSIDPEQRKLHAAWDVYYATAAMLGRDNRPDFRAADSFLTANGGMDVKGLSELRKALDTATSTEGSELIPTAFSATMVDKIALALRVVGLFVRFTMPTGTYRWPVQTGFATAYRMGQATTDLQFYTSLVTPSTPTTTNVLFDADKIAAAIFWSDEISQESIIPILPFVGDQVVLSISRALETAVINGSTLTTDLDNAAAAKLWTSTADARNSWNGLRNQVAASSVTKVDGGTFAVGILRTTKANMGVYGVDPTMLRWIVGPKSLTLFLGLTEVLTMEKFGPMATIVSGQLAQVDGSPIIPSEFIYENLTGNAVYDGVTTTKTMALLAHARAFYVADRRTVTLEQDRNVLSGQNVIVGVWRGDFQCMHGTEKVANVIRNMA